MKKIAAIVVATAMAVPLITGCGQVVVPDATTSETTVKELAPARAQDDYYRFINQDNFDKSRIKYGESGYELAFDDELMKEQVETVIKDCISGSGYAKGSEEEVIKKAYAGSRSRRTRPPPGWASRSPRRRHQASPLSP